MDRGLSVASFRQDCDPSSWTRFSTQVSSCHPLSSGLDAASPGLVCDHRQRVALAGSEGRTMPLIVLVGGGILVLVLIIALIFVLAGGRGGSDDRLEELNS